MTSRQVQCTRVVPANPDDVWAVLHEFDLSWHPMVTNCALRLDETGTLCRDFSAQDGGSLTEQLTYLSHSDRVLCYTALSGIEGARRYLAQVRVVPQSTGCRIDWQADIDAADDRADAIAEGTQFVLEAGLGQLAEGLPRVKSVGATSFPPSDVTEAVFGDLPRLGTLKGARSGQTLVLLLHGIGGQAGNWRSQIQHLGAHFCVAALDLRGYGRSSLGLEQTRIDDYCDDILAVMAQFKATRLVLVGLSYGSWIATSFAMRHPDKLAGLVLAGGCTGMSEASEEERAAFRAAREMPLSQGQTPADFAEDVIAAIAGPNACAATRAELIRSMSAIAVPVYRDALTCFANPEERFDFSKIACPVLMITGGQDPLAPPDEIRGVSLRIHDARVSNAGRANVQFEVLRDAGHVCNLEQPDAFNALLGRFLLKLPAAAQQVKQTRADKKDAKRRRIVNAAHEAFCKGGFDGVSMDQLASAAGVSKPTLYQYFGDKQGLFAAVLEEGKAQIIAPLLAAEGTLVDRLWAFSWTYAEFVLRPDMLSLARLILGEANRHPESAVKYHQSGPARALAGLTAFVEGCAAAKDLDVDDAAFAANDLWSLVLSGPRDHYLHHVADRPDQTELLRAIEHGLRVFLRAYSTHLDADLAELQDKVDSTRRKMHAP